MSVEILSVGESYNFVSYRHVRTAQLRRQTNQCIYGIENEFKVELVISTASNHISNALLKQHIFKLFIDKIGHIKWNSIKSNETQLR